MENDCICTNGGAPVRAVGAALSMLCTALVMATDPNCGPPNTQSCFAPNPGPGCADVDCCRTICGCDPFCCSVAWDGYCAGTGYVAGCGAQLLCDLPAAACCVDGACQTLNSGDCEAAGGTYMGTGTDCGTTVCAPPPANDDCADAIELLCDDVVVVDNTFATSEPDEAFFPLSCYFGGPNTVAGSVWFYVTGTGDTIEISTCLSTGSSDTLIAVYGGKNVVPECYITPEIACSEDAGCGPTGLLSRVCIDTEAGIVYTVLVGSFDNASRGEITVSVTCPCPVGACCFSNDGSCIDIAQSLCESQGGNFQGDGTECALTECPIFPDECAFPQPITCGESITVDQSVGTANPSDPGFSCSAAGPGAQHANTAWFSFVATGNGAQLSTCASPTTLDTLLAVYDGSCGSLVELACAEDSGCGPNGFLSELTVCGLTPGNTYLVQVAAFSPADAGLTTLSLNCDVFCPDCDTNGVCPPGGIDEAEPNCGIPTDTVNGGCNSAPVVLTSVNCGDVVCGTAAFDGALRDTDWYELTVVGGETNVSFAVETSGWPAAFGGIADANGNPSNSCATAAVISPFVVTNCGAVSICVGPGTYWFFVGPDFSQILPCDGTTTYVAEWICEAATCPRGACCLTDGSCVDDQLPAECGALGGTYQGDGTLCANVVCPVLCGPGNPNSCSAPSPTGTPGCSDAECCALVCSLDAFCCDVAWDALCAGAALTNCDLPPAACCFTDGTCDVLLGADCVAAGGEPQADPDCTTAVCPVICGPGNPNDCFVPSPTGTPGCSDAACCATVCSLDAFCCDVAWDGLCADAANTFCATEPQACCYPDGTCDLLLPVDCLGSGGTNQGAGTDCKSVVCPVTCGPGNPNDCFAPSPTGTPGCSDADCCNTVCAIDSFCCDVAWDSICAGEAAQFCGAKPVENDNCADRVEISDGVSQWSTVGATTDGADSGQCLSFGSTQVFNDIWFNYTPSCDGTLILDTCNSTFDTRLEVYDGLDCPAVNFLGCNDDGGPCADTFQSHLEVPVTCGNPVKIRAGGFSAAAVGTLEISVSCVGSPCPAGCGGDCVTSATFAPPPDGNVDAADLAFLLGEWGSPSGPSCSDTVTSATFAPPPDGNVDAADLAYLLGNWGSPGCQ